MSNDDLRRLLTDDLPEPPASLSTAPLENIHRRARRRQISITSAAALVVLITAGVAIGVEAYRGGALAPLFGSDACAGSTLPTTPMSPAPGEATPQPGGSAGLSELADAVHRLGDDQYRTTYAGLIMDTEHDRVLVWRIPSREFDRAVAAMPGHEKIVMMCATHSYADLLATTDQLLADQEYWKSRGLALNQFGPEYRDNCVLVTTLDPVRAQAELTARYPKLPLCFTYGAGEQLAR
ncbi:hypothetical protein HDA40_002025 [Hamadaea flava]|uniref:DUF3105 domain-containing protein n=1 Tax=Hamadaea flava TaxID=1742688 RepID=A0ABV8M1E8_9ACTN|nr:hypothetical protein [Hamadaea flava]MCP2323518.1 hypothetical protein [Hamadaea flava]